MAPQLVRVSCGLLTALLVAVLLKFFLFEWGSSGAASQTPTFALLWASLGYVLAYGLPLAIPAVIVTEIFRTRRVTEYIGLGVFIALVAAHLSVRGETLTSPVFSGGTLTGLFLLIAGVVPSLVYWIVAGRRAGWRGDAAERSVTLSADAFRTAGSNAQVEYCRECLIGVLAVGLLFFVLFSWVLIDATGLRGWLVAETELHGKAVLKTAGYTWATFKVEGDRGVIEGLAPDEVEKRAAYDSLREALGSVTGFPGVLSKIKNESVARMANSAVSQKLADATQRENEAKAAIEAARIAADAARAAESEAKRKSEEQAIAAQAEIARKLDEQARVLEEDARRKVAAAAAAAAAAAQAAPAAAETEAKRKLEEQVRAAEEEARRAAEAAPAQPVEVAATEAGGQEVAGPHVGNDVAGANSPALEPAPRAGAKTCSSLDLAIIESSRILFDMQMFEIASNYNGELDRLAASAQACAPRPIMVSGYADNNGDNLFNSALGLQRAEAVRNLLTSRGVPATLVLAKFAETPVTAHNGMSKEERALNRRTDFRLLEASEISRDATLDPDERATTCESDLSEIMTQSTIYFPTASARVSEESAGLINKLAKAIATCGSVIVTVEGHTDRIGGPGYNQSLSESRANAVRESLIAAGANPTRVASRGFASNRPSDPSDTAEAFALNRRIEFKVSGKFTSTNTGGP